MPSPLKEKIRPYLFAAGLAVLASAIFHGLALFKFLPWTIVYSDIAGFYSKAVAPGFPYLTKLIEYPVLTGLFIQLSGFIGRIPAGYFLFNALGLIIAAEITAYFLVKTAGENQRQKIFAYWVLAPSLLFFSVYNWDLFAVLFSVLAFYSMKRGRDGWAAFFLALGFSAKFYPILYLPPLFS